MPYVDINFVVNGDEIPADHGYALYGAVSRVLPFLHAPASSDTEGVEQESLWKSIGIHPINGVPAGRRRIALNRASRLRIRIPSEFVPTVLSLAGKRLDIDGSSLLVGVPSAVPLFPAPTLRCRLAVIKGHTDPDPFLQAARTQADKLGIGGTLSLIPRKSGASREGRFLDTEGRSPWIRRTLRIQDREVVGYAVTATGLTDEESVTLQAQGLGGRRRFGCGIFVPVKD